MKDSTSVGVAYCLLARGVHLKEIQRFVDAGTPAIDPNAETIPAPPQWPDGSEDPDAKPTTRAPERSGEGKRLITATELLAAVMPADATQRSRVDQCAKSDEFWGEVNDLVRQLR